MSFSRFFRGQVPKRIDHVEGGIDLLLDGKVRHVPHVSRFRQTGSLETGIAIGNRLLVQIIPRDFVSRLRKLDHQPTGATRRFEQPFDRSLGIFLKTLCQKLEFGRPVGAEDQIIVFRIVVQMAGNRFHESA